MSDLRDQLLKAGLVTAEQAKKAEAPPERTRPPRPPRRDGGPGRPEPQPERAAPTGTPKEIAERGRLDGRFRGGRRWYYISRRGVVPCLELNDDAVGRLESGAAAIAESPNGDAWLIDAAAARALADDERGGGRDWLRLWNGGP